MPIRHRRSTGTANRRRTAWATSQGTITFATNGTWATLDLGQQFKALLGAELVGSTIMRTHLTIQPSNAQNADLWWVGLRVDDLDQVAPTPQANNLVGNPRDNPGLDWMFNKRLQNDQNGNAGSAMGAYTGLVLDLKSKRKMQEVQQAFLLTIVMDNVATQAKSYQYFARFLVALP